MLSRGARKASRPNVSQGLSLTSGYRQGGRASNFLGSTIVLLLPAVTPAI
jgi:hypothetical protein